MPTKKKGGKKKFFTCRYKENEKLIRKGFSPSAVVNDAEGKKYLFKMTKELKKEVGE